MPVAHWPVHPDSYFEIDIALGGNPYRCRVDTGLTDTLGEIGFKLDPALFSSLERSGRLLPMPRRTRRDANGFTFYLTCGLIRAQLLDPSTGQPVGPLVKLLAARAASGLDSRVGVVFFHRLTRCRVTWELDARKWCVEYP
jgi:hypothetical protein